ARSQSRDGREHDVGERLLADSQASVSYVAVGEVAFIDQKERNAGRGEPGRPLPEFSGLPTGLAFRPDRAKRVDERDVNSRADRLHELAHAGALDRESRVVIRKPRLEVDPWRKVESRIDE